MEQTLGVSWRAAAAISVLVFATAFALALY